MAERVGEPVSTKSIHGVTTLVSLSINHAGVLKM